MRTALPIGRAAKFLSLSLVALLAAGAPIAAGSQSDPVPVAPNIPAPEVADIMGQTQLRHFKLWFAGALGNWPLANFEVERMKLSLIHI